MIHPPEPRMGRVLPPERLDMLESEEVAAILALPDRDGALSQHLQALCAARNNWRMLYCVQAGVCTAAVYLTSVRCTLTASTAGCAARDGLAFRSVGDGDGIVLRESPQFATGGGGGPAVPVLHGGGGYDSTASSRKMHRRQEFEALMNGAASLSPTGREEAAGVREGRSPLPVCSPLDAHPSTLRVAALSLWHCLFLCLRTQSAVTNVALLRCGA